MPPHSPSRAYALDDNVGEIALTRQPSFQVSAIANRFVKNDYGKYSRSSISQQSPLAFLNSTNDESQPPQKNVLDRRNRLDFDIPKAAIDAVGKNNSAPDETSKSRFTVATAYVVKQEWEGCVEELDQSMVLARLVDVRDALAPITYARIPMVNFVASERSRLQTGTIFRWAIGTQIRGSTHANMSEIRIRFIPTWTKREISSAKTEADELFRNLSAVVHDTYPPAK